MSITTLIFFVIIAAICGGIGTAIVGGGRRGLLSSIAVGFVGALIGPWLASLFGLGEPLNLNVNGHSFPVLWSILGAALCVATLHLVSRRRR